MLLQRALTLGHAAAGLGLVDHVVVVERPEVDELDRDRAADDLGAMPAGRPDGAVAAAARVRAGRSRLPPARSGGATARRGSVVGGRDRVAERVLDPHEVLRPAAGSTARGLAPAHVPKLPPRAANPDIAAPVTPGGKSVDAPRRCES